jgi:hypothetical protein
MGLAMVSLRYPADRAYWNNVEVKVSGTVGGTETTPRSMVFPLGGIASDYTDDTVAPPGATSPYGSSPSCTTAN